MQSEASPESSYRLDVDIATVLVPEGRRIWRLFPGPRYRFMNIFDEEGLVFLDFPGLDLPPGRLTPDTPNLLGRLIVSHNLREWLRLGAPDQKPPRLDPYGYANAVPSKRDQQFIAALAGLFGTAARGDIVLVPDQLSNRRILVGEFTNEPEDRVVARLPKRYGEHPMPARTVQWLSRADKAKNSEET